MSEEEREFRDITADIDEMLAQPELQEELAAAAAEMRAADRAYAMGLAALRHAADLTQAELAKALGSSQAAVSKLEARAGRGEDLLLSTLSSYIGALGGRMRVVVVFEGKGDREIEVDLPAVRPRQSSHHETTAAVPAAGKARGTDVDSAELP